MYPEQGLTTKTYRGDRARPDGCLAPVGYFAGHGEWGDPSGVLMTVEVTSRDSDTHRHDRVEKRDGYAAAGIPVHLLVDRDRDTLTVFTGPEDGTYHQQASYPFGATVPLPGPVDITLDTEKLKDYAH
ncbi:Uma2 family endonuclease [Streptomyces sp. NPDC048370]|uniref:Uma2 family endonuclease n=1 Tax=Streptomyces sp. NPDC048370 TaxID=3365540 RepID=UPI00371B9680